MAADETEQAYSRLLGCGYVPGRFSRRWEGLVLVSRLLSGGPLGRQCPKVRVLEATELC